MCCWLWQGLAKSGGGLYTGDARLWVEEVGE